MKNFESQKILNPFTKSNPYYIQQSFSLEKLKRQHQKHNHYKPSPQNSTYNWLDQTQQKIDNKLLSKYFLKETLQPQQKKSQKYQIYQYLNPFLRNRRNQQKEIPLKIQYKKQSQFYNSNWNYYQYLEKRKKSNLLIKSLKKIHSVQRKKQSQLDEIIIRNKTYYRNRVIQ